jgi:hypothetical protein
MFAVQERSCGVGIVAPTGFLGGFQVFRRNPELSNHTRVAREVCCAGYIQALNHHTMFGISHEDLVCEHD